MGTILQSLSTRASGLYLYESFESSNFMLDEGWQLLNGTPVRSDSVAKNGLYSLIMDSSYPLISKKFNVPFKYSTVWFYDDASQMVSLYSPRVQWISSADGRSVTIGVDNSISTGFYIITTLGMGAVVTTVARTTGWHRFTLVEDGFGGAYVDNQHFNGFGHPNPMDTIKVGSFNSTGTPFGYFDWVQVLADYTITMYGVEDGQYLNVVLDSNGVIMQAQAAGTGKIATVDVSTVDFPTPGYMTVTTGTYGSAVFFQSDMLSLVGGDIYLLNLYRFGRQPTNLSDFPAAMRNDTKAIGGPKQSVFFYDQDQVSMSFQGLTEAEKDDLLRWWTTTKRGETFSVAFEEEDILLDYTQAPVIAYPTGQLVLSTPAVATGQILTVQSVDGAIKENVTIAAVSADPMTGFYTVDLAQPQAEAVLQGMQVKNLYYWPFATTMMKTLPFVLENQSTKRWTVSISFEELIQNPSWIEFILNQT